MKDKRATRCVVLLILSIGCAKSTTNGPLSQNITDPLPAWAIARIGTARLRHPAELVSLAVSPNGDRAASAAGWPHPSVIVWDLTTGKELFHTDSKDCFVAISPDGKTLATCGQVDDHDVRLWDLRTGDFRRSVKVIGDAKHPVQGISGVAFLGDRQSLAVETWYEDTSGSPVYPRFRTIRILSLQSGQMVDFHFPDESGYVGGNFSFSLDGKRMSMISGHGQTIYLWNTGTQAIIDRFASGAVSAILSPDGRRLAIADRKAIRIVEIATNKTLCTIEDFDGHIGGPGPIAWSPGGDRIASGGGYGDPVLRVWNARTGRLVQKFERYPGEQASALAFTNDGTTIVAAEGMTVRIWDIASGKENILNGVLRRSLSSLRSLRIHDCWRSVGTIKVYGCTTLTRVTC